jgi:hypothetical protein
MKKLIAIAIATLAVFGLLGAIDAVAAAYPTGVGGTGTVATPAAGQVLVGTGGGTYTPAYLLCAGTCQTSVASGTVTINGTGVATNTGNWSGSWQLYNPSDFLSSSTQYVQTVNGASGVVTITSSTLGVVWPSVNGTKATNYVITGANGIAAALNGATTTLSVALNNNSPVTCSAGQFLNTISATGTAQCGSITFPTAPTYTNVGGIGIAITTATSSSNTTSTFTNTGVTSFNGSKGTVTVSAGAGILITASGTAYTVSNAGVLSLAGSGCVTFSNTTGTLTTTVTCVSTTTGDWAGTWQGVNSSTFYFASNPSGYITTSTFNATGTAGYVPLWSSGGNSLTPTSSIFVSSTGNVGIGMTTPDNVLQVVSGTTNLITFDPALFNTLVGQGAGNLTMTGSYDTAQGFSALGADTSGGGNTAEGYGALTHDTTGSNNTAEGYGALTHDTGSYNTALGYSALNVNTSGGYNVAEGYGALLNDTGSSNVALGFDAGEWNTGSNNQLFVNNVNQSTYANDKAYSLLYGNFAGAAATTTGQQLTVNGALNVVSNATTTASFVESGTATTTLSLGSASSTGCQVMYSGGAASSFQVVAGVSYYYNTSNCQ